MRCLFILSTMCLVTSGLFAQNHLLHYSLDSCTSILGSKFNPSEHHIFKTFSRNEFKYGRSKFDQFFVQVDAPDSLFLGMTVYETYLGINKDSLINSVHIQLEPSDKADQIIENQYGTPDITSDTDNTFTGIVIKGWNKKTYTINTVTDRFLGDTVRKLIVRFSRL